MLIYTKSLSVIIFKLTKFHFTEYPYKVGKITVYLRVNQGVTHPVLVIIQFVGNFT